MALDNTKSYLLKQIKIGRIVTDNLNKSANLLGNISCLAPEQIDFFWIRASEQIEIFDILYIPADSEPYI